LCLAAPLSGARDRLATLFRTEMLGTVDPEQLAECRVLDTQGRTRRLGDEWRSQPAIVVWLRHFGCLFCREMAADFRARQEEIAALGARLVFVGNGEVRWAREFAAQECPECRLLTDPGLGSYRAIGARRGWSTTLGARSVASGWRAFRRGFRQTAVRGVADQQGGVLAVLPGDRIAYAYISASAGDHPPVDAVLAALRRALRPAPRATQPAR
jgi:peroxiredoxin